MSLFPICPTFLSCFYSQSILISSSLFSQLYHTSFPNLSQFYHISLFPICIHLSQFYYVSFPKLSSLPVSRILGELGSALAVSLLCRHNKVFPCHDANGLVVLRVCVDRQERAMYRISIVYYVLVNTDSDVLFLVGTFPEVFVSVNTILLLGSNLTEK